MNDDTYEIPGMPGTWHKVQRFADRDHGAETLNKADVMSVRQVSDMFDSLEYSADTDADGTGVMGFQASNPEGGDAIETYALVKYAYGDRIDMFRQVAR